MVSIKEINQKEFELCYELDLDTICLWTKKQWQSEFTKRGTKVVALFFKNDVFTFMGISFIISFYNFQNIYNIKNLKNYLERKYLLR